MKTENWNKLNEIFHEALELDESEREKFIEEKCKDNQELKKEVLNLLESAESKTDFLNNNAIGKIPDYEEFVEDLEGKEIDDYKILKEIGRGGMGAVFLAEHKGEGFTQNVALKLIKRGMDTNAVLKRFLLERQILASLEHPNIARLLDGGSTEDGLPYFAMEYIEGEPLRKFCENQKFDTNERLELFLKVCRAVSYAHQKLVVHRDIKPSNIIVTEDGIPKLLDFGIGKILSPNWNESTAEATATQMRLMTPEYASPEQLRGQITTTSTDVYSLGIVLYELLTGTRPYKFESSNPIEISEKLSTEEPVKPSDAIVTQKHKDAETKEKRDVNTGENVSPSPFLPFSPSQLRGDLDNIILKAIRKDTERRYRSVQEFADDIERFLKGLPVSATADSSFYRLQKFVKRHQAGVFSALAFALLLIGATAITTWQYFKAQQAQAKAEQRFNDVRKLANSVVFDLHDSIKDLPGATPARELLVRNALEYLDGLAKEAENDTDLQLELADAYSKIGDVQGGYADFHLGQRKKAKESYKKAFEIRKKLYESNPNNPTFQTKLALSYQNQGNMFFLEPNLEESQKAFEKASEMYEKLLQTQNDNQEIRRNLSTVLSLIGFIYANKKDFPKDEEINQKAISIAEALARENPKDEKIGLNLARVYENYGISQNVKQNPTKALDFYGKAADIIKKLMAENSKSVLLKMKYAKLNYLQGIGVYNQAGKNISMEVREKSLKHLTESRNTYVELLATDPENQEFRRRLPDVETLRAKLFSEMGNPEKALEVLKKSLDSLEQQKKDSPNENLLLASIGIVYEKLGETYATLAKNSSQESIKNWKSARENFQKSLDIFKKFKEEGNLVGVETNKIDSLEKKIAESDKAIGN